MIKFNNKGNQFTSWQIENITYDLSQVCMSFSLLMKQNMVFIQFKLSFLEIMCDFENLIVYFVAMEMIYWKLVLLSMCFIRNKHIAVYNRMAITV